MSKALSLDLRVRVLAAVQAGATHRQAGERFGVSAASVSRWRAREREQGDARPKALGGDRRSKRIEACGEAVISALGPDGDATIEEVRRTLAAQGLSFGCRFTLEPGAENFWSVRPPPGDRLRS